MVHAPRVPILALGLAALLCGCGKEEPKPVPAGPGPAPAGEKDPGPGVHFEECAAKVGITFRTTFLAGEQGESFRINLYDHGSGISVGDFDGDGFDDIYFVNQLGANALYRNRGNGTFEDVTANAGVGLDDRISVAAVWGDADGDGDLDLYVTTVRAGNVYFENLGGGKFRDATKDAGLELVTESMSPTFFDADGDGDLDLLVTNTAHWTQDSYHEKLRYFKGKETLAELISSEREWNNFYRNDGKGHFTDVTEEAGLRGKGWGGDTAIFDMDGDGDLDVFICNMFGSSMLYRNDGKGVFKDVTRETLGRTSWGAVGARAFDYDGDGLIDLFVADMHSDMWMPFRIEAPAIEEHVKYPTFFSRSVALGFAKEEDDRAFILQARIKPEEVVFGNTLFRNKGNGAFEEVSDKSGAECFWPWGIAEGDFDNDGFVDAYIPTGMGHPLFYWHPSLLHNQGNGTFKDVSGPAGVDPPPGGPYSDVILSGKPASRSQRAAATIDIDGDGRLDLLVGQFNDKACVYRNVSRRGHWCGLRLVATRTNRSAVGALVKLTAGGRTQVRQVQAAGGYLTQSTNDLQFGLGSATAVEKIEIRWPSGQVQVIEKPKADARTTITEPR